MATGRYSDRCRLPEDTWERIKPLLPSFGITRVSRLTGLDRIGIPVWNAVAPNARAIVIGQGKGLTDADARVSAAMEAIERTVAGCPSIAVTTASRADLRSRGLEALPLNQLIARGQADLQDIEICEWIQAEDLLAESRCYLPLEAVKLDRTSNAPRYWQSSDGLASGNTRNEAVLHGLLERIERDAYTLWQISPLEARRSFDAGLFADPVIDGLLERITAAGFVIKLFDMTTDLGVPCVTALLAPADFRKRRDLKFFEVNMGSGAHPTSVRAVIRAITEAAQSRMTYVSGARDDIPDRDFIRLCPDDTRACLELPLSSQHFPLRADGDVDDLLRWVLKQLGANGIRRLLVVDLGGGDMPISVVKIIVPELENPDGRRKHRFGPRAISRAMEMA